MAGNNSLVVCLWLLLAFPSALPAAGLTPTELRLKLLGIREARPPEVAGDRLILTFQADRPVRRVVARFAHEEYRRLHVYERSPSGVFILAYPLPEGLVEVRYRIAVDGLWMADPANPLREPDPFGTEFSRVTLAEPAVRPLDSPEFGADGTVTLWLRAAAGKARVTVSGSFNGWDPFAHPLSEVRPGLYRASLRLLPGRYWYHFWVDGDRRLDSLNAQTGIDEDGAMVSTFVVPAPARSGGADLDYLDLRLLTSHPAE